MAKFDHYQAADVLAVQQVINEWAYDLDVNNGANVANFLTDDCLYSARGAYRHGKEDAAAFYVQRLADLSASPTGVPIHRHALFNFRVDFTGPDEAEVNYALLYFNSLSPGLPADPASYADVSMTCRRCADDHWRIARFDSEPVFIRTAE